MNLELKQRLIEMRAKGYSYDKIAKELGKAKQTVIDWAKELDEEISNLKAMELEALYENYSLLKESRLKNLGNLFNKVRNEIEERDLSDVPTDKLLALYIKLNETVRSEIVEPTILSSKEINSSRLTPMNWNDEYKGKYEPLLIGEPLNAKDLKELKELQLELNELSREN